MIPVKYIDPDDLALYALQLLSPEDTHEMTENLRHSAEARRMLAELQGDIAVCAMSSEASAPPASARDRLMTQVGREKKAIPVEQTLPDGHRESVAEMPKTTFEEEPRRSLTGRVLPWIGWAAAAAMTVEAGLLYQRSNALEDTLASQNAQVAKLTTDAERANLVLQTMKDPEAVRVTLTSGPPPVPQGRVSYVANNASLVFLASNLLPLPTNKTYELWLIPADGRAPVAAGTFQPDAHGSASVILPELPKGLEAKAFGITIEDAGGAPSPTLPIILKGAAS